MADNSIERIRQAELLADEKIREAHKEAAQMIENAKNDADRLMQDSESAAVALSAESVSLTRKKNEAALVASATETEHELELLAKQAIKRQEEAVAEIMKVIA